MLLCCATHEGINCHVVFVMPHNEHWHTGNAVTHPAVLGEQLVQDVGVHHTLDGEAVDVHVKRVTESGVCGLEFEV